MNPLVRVLPFVQEVPVIPVVHERETVAQRLHAHASVMVDERVFRVNQGFLEHSDADVKIIVLEIAQLEAFVEVADPPEQLPAEQQAEPHQSVGTAPARRIRIPAGLRPVRTLSAFSLFLRTRRRGIVFSICRFCSPNNSTHLSSGNGLHDIIWATCPFATASVRRGKGREERLYSQKRLCRRKTAKAFDSRERPRRLHAGVAISAQINVCRPLSIESILEVPARIAYERLPGRLRRRFFALRSRRTTGGRTWR